MELFRRLSFAMVLLTLAGCGGGDGGLSTGGGEQPVDVKIEWNISGPTSYDQPAEITINIQENDSGVSNRTVNLAISDENIASLEGGVTSVTTDSSGNASINLIAGDTLGEAEITLTYTASNDEDYESTLPIVNAGGAVQISLSLSNTRVSNLEPVTVSATITNEGQPFANTMVSFQVDDTELAHFSPESGRVLTNDQGVATIDMLAGTKAGAGQLVVSVVSPSGQELFYGTFFESAGDGEDVGEGPDVASVTLYANSQQLASSGAQEILLTAIAKDSSNNLIPSVDISFVSDSGDILVTTSDEGVKSSTTNESGQATATLKTQGNPENRTIVVTANNGAISDSVNVYVIGTEVQLSGSSSLALNDANTFIINVLDSDSEGIADVEVALSLANTPADGVANLTFPSSVTTSPEGQAVVSVVGETGGANTIIASALGASVSKSVQVQADSFLFTGFNNGDGSTIDPSTGADPADVLLSDTATVTLTWNRSGTPVADGTVVEFSTTRGVLTAGSGVIAGGQVTATLTSTDAGKAIVTFSGTDGDIELSNQFEFEFVAETVDRLVAQASPNSIGPDEQTSTISVVARDPNGNLVKNKTIVFSLSDTTGGSIFPAEAVTDSDGSASTVYTSNTVSAQDEVLITATVKDQPTVSDSVALTVADRELFISLGTGNEIEDNETTYTKRFVAFVTDADSNPVVGQNITISAVPEGYYKGQWVPIYDGDEFVVWDTRDETTLNQPHYCTNEDDNRDGILDPGEDTNNNGSLTPGNVIASLLTVNVEGDSVASADAVTDSEGKVLIDLVYAQSYGNWVDVNLIASGKVAGTESFVKTTYTLPVSAEDVNNEDITPPTAAIGLNGPFGLRSNCSIPD